MNLQHLETRLKQVVSLQLGVAIDDIKHTSNFVDDLGADSMDLVELLFHVDEAFDVEIADDDAAPIKTFGDALQFLAGMFGAKPPEYGVAQDVTVQLNLDDETFLNNFGKGNATAGVRALIDAHRRATAR